MSSYRFSDMSLSPPLPATAVSGTNTYSTGPIKAIDFETFTFQAEWTGTPTGVLSILGSLDGVNFRNFGATVQVQPAGSSGGVVAPLYGHGMKWLQMNYVNSTGSGTLTISALGKTR